jgi:hypothetical protein
MNQQQESELLDEVQHELGCSTKCCTNFSPRGLEVYVAPNRYA